MRSFIITLLGSAVAIWVAAALVPGVELAGVELTEQALTALLVGLVFGLVNAVIKPVVRALTFPLFILSFGLFALVVNALLFWLTAWLAGLFDLPFTVDGFGPAFLGALVVSVVSWAIGLAIKD